MKILNQDGIGEQSFSLPSDWEKTIGSGQDYTDIASAIAAIERKYISHPKLTLDAGTYSEKILDGTEKLLCPVLEIVGDIRDIVGTTYIDTFTIRTNDSNGGSGTCAISNSGNDITITGTSANPNFSLAGLVSGDKIITLDNSNNIAEYTIDSVSSNTITLTTNAPTIGNSGTSVCILPNRRITSSSSLLSGDFPCKIKITGFHLEGSSSSIIRVTGKEIVCNNCVFDQSEQNTYMLDLSDSLFYSTNSKANVSFWDSGFYGMSSARSNIKLSGAAFVKTNGLYLQEGSRAYLESMCCSAGGLASSINYMQQSSLYAISSQIYGYYRGFQPNMASNVIASSSYIAGCNIGIYALNGSFFYGTSLSLASNTTDASPSGVGTYGNNGAMIVRS